MADTDIFETMLADAGIPTSADGIQAQWDAIAADADIQISNDSDYSPFWRLISSIITTPAQWLTTLLIQYVLPNAFLKYAGGTWLDLFAWGRDLDRKEATAVIGNILFTRESSVGDVVIEAGILIATPEINGTVYRVVVSAETTLADGTLSALVPVVGEKTGADYNLGAGYYSVLPEAITGIESVTNESDWITTEGSDEESDEALRLRCGISFQPLGNITMTRRTWQTLPRLPVSVPIISSSSTTPQGGPDPPMPISWLIPVPRRKHLLTTSIITYQHWGTMGMGMTCCAW